MLPDLLDNAAAVRLVRARHGLMAYLPQDSVIGRSIEAYGEYFESETAIFRQILGAGDVAVDVGANIGTHTLAMAGLVGSGGRVVAFEAQSTIHQLLSANLALNGLSWVRAFPAAAGDQLGEIAVPEPDYARPGNFGGVALGGTQGPRVPVLPLDAVAACAGARLIKIDVEGMESAVLAGAQTLLRRDRPVIYVENDRVERSPELIDRLRGFGYRLFWHFAPFFNPENFARNPERILPVGYFPNESGVYLCGLATNMLCFPAERRREAAGFAEVGDRQEHPCKPEHRARLTPGIPTFHARGRDGAG